MASGIQSTILKMDENFSIITIERVEYNDCRALIIYSSNDPDVYSVDFCNKDNLSVSSCFIIYRNKLEKVIEYCFRCINYNKAISMYHITKIIP